MRTAALAGGRLSVPGEALLPAGWGERAGLAARGADARAELLPPASGAWREGDPAGARRFADLGVFEPEHGGRIDRVRVAYETHGELDADRSNAILVLHALTGDAHAAGPAGPGQPTAGWWNELIGPGLAIDTSRHFVVSSNLLGGCQGTTGPASSGPDGRELGPDFPPITVRDQVRVQRRLADHLGIERWHAVIGGSMGGMHALEWAIEHPECVERLAVLACPARLDADQIAINTVQCEAVTIDGGFRGGRYYDAERGEGPHRGLALARRMAMLNYRSQAELNARFGRSWQSGLDPSSGAGRFSVESYLDFHGNRFTRRFDANSYLALVRAMNSHDIGRGRGGLEAALARIEALTLVAGVDTDLLFPLTDQHVIARGLRRSLSGRRASVIESAYGHDGFLLETEQVGSLLGALLAL